MPAVDSAAKERVDYDAFQRTLFVRFRSGEWYAYLDVPALTYQRLLAADSKGAFFQKGVRDRFAFVRLDTLSRR